MESLEQTLKRLMLGTCAAALLASSPLAVSFDKGGVSFEPAKAFADSGSDDDDDDGGSDDDDDDGGSDDDDDDGGSDDDDDDGSDDDDDDGSDDDDDDGSDDDDDDRDGRSGNRGGDDRRERNRERGSKVEVTRSGIEVRHADGTKEEIENGRYERKDANGRTVEQRRATNRDFRRLVAAGRTQQTQTEASVDRSQVSKYESSRNSIEVVYSSGWKEEIEFGRYELKDPNNRTVVERPATSADVQKLRALAGS